MKYDDPSLINHGERAKPSSCSTTAAARAPTRIDDSTHPLYHPLPVVVAVADPMRAGAIFASCAANLAPLQTPQIPLQAEAQGGVAEAAGHGGSCCGTGADGIAMEFQYRAGDERRSRSPPLPTPSPPAALSTSGSGSAGEISPPAWSRTILHRLVHDMFVRFQTPRAATTSRQSA